MSQGNGFDSQWGQSDFSLDWSLKPHNGSGFGSASKRNEYQVHYLVVKVAGV